ncbi:MAG: aldehyde ferredoxin oxidoreductase, partial [Thermovirga sp.]|nr:aldehyde ferredoxin oxidoreductase [Thermovirga sp.]
TFPEFGYETVQDRKADEGKGIMTARFQDLMAVADSLKVCKFSVTVGTRVEEYARWLSLVTGWNVTPEELLETGERIFTLKRLYNAALGMGRKEDSLPERILKQPRGTGESADTLPDLERQLDEYYQFRGWTMKGLPTDETLEKLGLERL